MKSFFSEETYDDLAKTFAEVWNKRVRSIRITGIVVSAVMIVLGFLLWLFPSQSIGVIETIAAALIMVLGVYELVEFFTLPVVLQRGGILINSILNIVLGVMLLCSPAEVTIGTFAFFFGFLLLIFGTDLLAFSGKLGYFGVRGYGWVIALGVVSLCAAALFLILPLASTVALNYLMAIYLIIAGVTLLVKLISLQDLTIR